MSAVLLAGNAAPAFAQAVGAVHDHAGKIRLEELPVELRTRARTLWSNVICACPSENWSKSLLNCPDGCADAQKQEILQHLQDGWDDEAILKEQLDKYSSRVIGAPDDVLSYALPLAALVASVVVLGTVYASLRRRSAQERAERGTVRADEGELAAVERELQELR